MKKTEFKPEHKEILRSNGWLATRAETFQDGFLSIGHCAELDAGAPVYRLGKTVTHVYGLIEGQIDVHLTAPNGEDLVFPFPLPGKWYGLIYAVAGEPAFGSAYAKSTSLVHCIPKADLLAFLNAEPDRYRHIIAHEFVVRQQMQETVLDLVTRDGTDLVARRLLRMMETEPAGQTSTLSISQVQLASALGLSPPTVQRAFRELRGQGLIEARYGSVSIADRDRLARYVGDEDG